MQKGFGRGPSPIVFRTFEPVQGGRENIVKLGQITCRHQRLAIQQAWMLVQFFKRFGLHGVDKHAGADQPVETTPDGPVTGRQINRRAHTGNGTDCLGGLLTRFFSPAQQRIAPKEMPAVMMGPAYTVRKRCKIQPISSKSPEWYARDPRLSSPLQPRECGTANANPRSRAKLAKTFEEWLRDDSSRP